MKFHHNCFYLHHPLIHTLPFLQSIHRERPLLTLLQELQVVTIHHPPKTNRWKASTHQTDPRRYKSQCGKLTLSGISHLSRLSFLTVWYSGTLKEQEHRHRGPKERIRKIVFWEATEGEIWKDPGKVEKRVSSNEYDANGPDYHDLFLLLGHGHTTFAGQPCDTFPHL